MRTLSMALLVTLVASLCACGGDAGPAGGQVDVGTDAGGGGLVDYDAYGARSGPEIANVELTPNPLWQAEISPDSPPMFVTVTMGDDAKEWTVSNADVFIHVDGKDRTARKARIAIQKHESPPFFTLVDIPMSWLSGLDPGKYSVTLRLTAAKSDGAESTFFYPDVAQVEIDK